jgi:4-hydroxy-4-methyl-2-oxoglutarate aldolase
MDDQALVATIRQNLFTAVVGDVLDAMGHRRQFLPPNLQPLDPATVIVGRAMPVVEADVYDLAGPGKGPLAREAFGKMFDALDDLQQGEIYIATGASPAYALWGGLMSTRAAHLGAAGAILDGYVRDAREIAALGFPVFSHGLFAQDQGVRGKVIDWRTPIEIGGVRIDPGDLVFGDREGVLIIPRAAEAEAIAAALRKASTENDVARAIRAGMPARTAWETFGVM